MVDVANQSLLTELTAVLHAMTDGQAKLLTRLRSTSLHKVVVISAAEKSIEIATDTGAAPATPQDAIRVSALDVATSSWAHPVVPQTEVTSTTPEIREVASSPNVAASFEVEDVAGVDDVTNIHKVALPVAEPQDRSVVTEWPEAKKPNQPAPRIAKRDYDFFAELDAKLAGLSESPLSHPVND